jgi:hypothetical protein
LSVPASRRAAPAVIVLQLPAARRRFATEDRVSDEEVIVLRKYVSEVEATMAHLVLEAHNIPSAVMRDTAGGMIPSMAILYPVRLAVRREDADEARRILDTEAPLPGEDGAGETIDEPNDFSARWSPEDEPEDDEEDEPESDRRW